MPPEPSVTSACKGPRLCTLRYSSALLPNSFERPGPKSVSPAIYCSGVEVVVWCRWIVDMHAPFASRDDRDSQSSFDYRGSILLYWLLSLGGHELLSAVNVVGCACEGGIGHDVYGERGHIRRSDYASDGKGGAKLVATLFELIAQQFRGERRVHEAGGNDVDSHRCDFKRQAGGQGGKRSSHCGSNAQADSWASGTRAAHEDQRPSGSHFVGRI